MAWKVLVTARAFWGSNPAAKDLLESAGCDVVRPPQPGPLHESEIIARLEGCDAVIASGDAYTARVFETCAKLKVVSRWGVGIDSVDLKAASAAGVVVTNTPGAMTEAVADYTFALLLSVARRIVEGDAMMRAGGWGVLRGASVSGKTIGLVGAGMIGQAVARRAGGFGMKILAFDPPLMAANRDLTGLPPMSFVSFEELLAQSDFICLHAPNLRETQGMFDANCFSQMKPSAFLINTARGALVNQADLLTALESGQIAGAALDVFTPEPLPSDHPLRQNPRCVLTPHNAFNTDESTSAMNLMSVENVLALHRGDRPPTVCNPEVWDLGSCRL